MKQLFILKKGLLQLTTMLFLLTVSCSHSAFTVKQRSYHPTGKSVAVIAGINNEINRIAALHLTRSLTQHTSFQVISQEIVTNSVPNYPSNIKGPYKHAYLQIEPDYSRTDVKKLIEIHRKLGVDYLYVLWAPVASTGSAGVSQSVVQLYFIGQLFEFPEGKEIGNGMFGSAVGNPYSCFAPGPTPKEVEDQLKISLDYVAQRIARETNTERKP